MPQERVVYCTNVMASFARNDLVLLKDHYKVHLFHFAPAHKIFTPFVMFKQLIFLLRHLPGASISITQFAGYHSVLAVLFGKLFKVPSLLILGGTECVKFPSFGYGDHTRWPLGGLVRWSLANATHLAPVDECLVECDYRYARDPRDPVRQGYRGLFPGIGTPHTILTYGYDDTRFRPMGGREPGTFLTVSTMNAPNFFRKGADLVFEMAKRFPEHRFTIVGDSPGMEYPEIPNNLTLVRSVPYDELPGYYSRNTFYFQLSMWEGFPSAPCEAMLCGCIPIVSGVAALPEIVGEAGFILRNKDAELLENLINKALRSDKVHLGQLARERIRHRWPRGARTGLIRLVDRLIGKEAAILPPGSKKPR